MTDKEPIIVHGVDVSKCDRLNLASAYGWDDPDMCSIPCCKNAPNCLFKQLARKTQELEQYKKSKQASYETMQREWNKATLENRKLKQECEELKEKLRELKCANQLNRG